MLCNLKFASRKIGLKIRLYISFVYLAIVVRRKILGEISDHSACLSHTEKLFEKGIEIVLPINI